MSDDRHESISRRAYELWEKDGGDHGRHEEHWHQASREAEELSPSTPAPDGTTIGDGSGDADTEVAKRKSPAKRSGKAEPADSPAAEPAEQELPAAIAEPADTPTVSPTKTRKTKTK